MEILDEKVIESIDKENLKLWGKSRNEPSMVLGASTKILTLAEQNNYLLGKAWALGNIGSAHLWHSNYEEALEYTSAARELLHEAKDFKHEADIVYNLCVIFYFLGDYEKQLLYAKESLSISEQANYDSGKASAYNGIGLAYYTTNQNEKAIEYLLKGKEIAEKINDKTTLLKILDSIGQSYFNLEKYDEALPFKSDCAKVSAEVGEKSIEAYALDGIGEIYMKKGDYDQALSFCNQSLSIRKSLGFKSGEAETYMHIGEIYLVSDKIEPAKENLNEAITIATEIHDYNVIANSNKLLAEHYEKIENFKAYVTHFKAYHKARDLYNKESEDKKLKTFELKGRLEQMKEEQALLEQKNNELKTYFEDIQTLSEVGKEITSNLSISDINNQVYENVNKLMKADGFGIGIWDEEENTLSFPGYIEKGEQFEASVYDLTDENRLACVCFNQEKTILINHFSKEYVDYIPKMVAPVVGESVQSLIYLPLTVKDRKIGVITVQCFDSGAYSDYHLNIIKNLAIYTAIALDNAKLYENMEEKVKSRTIELKKNYDNIELLTKIGQELISTLDFESIIERLYKNVNELFDARIFGVRLYDKEKNTIDYRYDYEDGVRHKEIEVSMDDDNNYSVWCIKNNKEIFINDNKNEHTKYVEKVQVVAGEYPQSVIFYPLRRKGEPFGLITVQSLKKDAYNKYHLNILMTLAHYTGIALENARHYEIMEEEVRKRTQEIVEQKEIIEEKNKHITDSIHYAKRIQDATLPDKGLIKKYLQKSFVLFKPKDIVSGDFYWIEKKGDEIIFAVVDCTGHGVPGAFLSLIGHTGLNQIVNELNIVKPSDILEELNRSVYKALQNDMDDDHIQDGMDMSICSLNVKTNVLQFAGAYNPLYMIRNNEISEIKGDKITVGSGDKMMPNKFQNNIVQLEPNDCIYLFSDGYADQFGGPKGKKFKYSRFKEILIQINSKTMEEQHSILDSTINGWQGDLEQIDDVCIIGFKAS